MNKTPRHNLVVPIAGRGSRMESTLPKAMILAGDRTILEWGMQSLDYNECDVTFVILQEQAYNHGLDAFLEAKFPGCNVVQLEQSTRGAMETAFEGLAALSVFWDVPVSIFAPDIYFEPAYKVAENTSNRILTFKANSPSYSYIRKDPDTGRVISTREKIVISQEAAIGLYCFESGGVFIEFAKRAMKGNLPDLGEFYICPLYNSLIEDNFVVKTTEIPTAHIMGTREELDFFESQVYPRLQGPQEWVLCADHSGYSRKEVVKEYLEAAGEKVVDCGCYSTRDCDRYDFIQLATRRVLSRPGSIALGFCQSGQGMCMDANKVPGIRAALVNESGDGRLAIEHNNANFFGLPHGVGPAVIEEIKAGRFQGGRHQNRLMKVGL